MMRLNPNVVVEGSIYVAGCSFAIWKGGRPERIVSAAMLLEFVLGLSFKWIQALESPRYLSLLFDVGVLGAVLYVAFTTNLRWPLLASALQILSVLCFVARLVDSSIRSWAYVTVAIALGFGVLATVIYGAVQRVGGRASPEV